MMTIKQHRPASHYYVGRYRSTYTMSKFGKHHLLFVLIISNCFVFWIEADVGTASTYNPPYTPTECYGDDSSQFPSSNFFAAAGEAIWDNGAACGRQYLVRCISAAVPGTCVLGQTIQIRIVDHAQSLLSQPSIDGATMVLSDTAFGAIANPSTSSSSVNIEYQKV